MNAQGSIAHEDSCIAAPGAVDLSRYPPGSVERGAGRLKEGLWILIRSVLFGACPFRLYRLKRWVLRRFGAAVGRGVVIKPGVKILFPWRLVVGDHVWLGEECWLLNAARITIDQHVCISQRAMLVSIGHDYKSPDFGPILAPITIRRGCWIAAGGWVGQGVEMGSHAVLCACSVATKDMEPYGIYRGNPAVKIRTRQIRSE